MKQVRSPSRHTQRGVVVLIMFLVMFLAGASVFISFVSNNLISQKYNNEAIIALRDAKEALIAYAVTHGDFFGPAGAGPGHLPCPDTNGDGLENLPCGLDAIGRLPRSVTVPLPAANTILELSDYNIGIDEQLWYALADPARRTPVGPFNSNTTTTHTLNGQDDIAAVLIAPGEALTSQTRPSNDEADYLDGANATGTDFESTTGLGPDSFNDRVLAITVSEIMAPVTTRVAEALRLELDEFHDNNGRYPNDPALPLGDPTEITDLFNNDTPAWFLANEWELVTQYSQLTNNTATLTFTGCAGISYSLDKAADTMTRIGGRC